MEWEQHLQGWIGQMDFNRQRTLGLLDQVAKLPQPEQALGFRAGPGRAHIGWQFMHIGITEGLFATARLFPDQPPLFGEIAPRYQGGSTPDDDLPTIEQIRDVLQVSREKLYAAVASFNADDLGEIRVSLKDGRKLTLQQVMHILAWHEPHHQGQAHLTLNSFKVAASGT